MSLKQTIAEYLKAEYPRIVHKGEIGRKAVLDWGYENENAGRRCRELENAGIIKRITNKKGEAQYQYNLGQSYKAVSPIFTHSEACCYSFKAFKVHGLNCKEKNLTEKVSNQLF